MDIINIIKEFDPKLTPFQEGLLLKLSVVTILAVVLIFIFGVGMI